MPVHKKSAPKNNLQKLRSALETMQKKDLCELVIEHAQRDTAFYEEMCRRFLQQNKQVTLQSIKCAINHLFHAFIQTGCISKKECIRIRKEADQIIGKAYIFLEDEQVSLSLEVALYLFKTVAKTIVYAPNLGHYFDSMIEKIKHLIYQCTQALIQAQSPQMQKKHVTQICKVAQNMPFHSDYYWGYDLLCAAACLATNQTLPCFHSTLHILQTKYENTKSVLWRSKEYFVTYMLIQYTQGQQAAWQYLYKHLHDRELRQIAVKQDIANKNYVNAERLCLELIGGDTVKAKPSKWEYLLFEIYQKMQKRDKQIDMAKHLLLNGDYTYYAWLKNTFTELGEWDAVCYPLLNEVKQKRGYAEYMKFLAVEKEYHLLLEQVKTHPETVFIYGDRLMNLDPECIIALCIEQIWLESGHTNNKNKYRQLTKHLVLLGRLGGESCALQMITKLKKVYPRRTAMVKEIESAFRNTEIYL